MVTLTLPEWLWITAFLGCFLFGGICAGVLLFALFGREEHEPKREPYRAPPRPPVDTLPEIWPPGDEHTRTKISRV